MVIVVLALIAVLFIIAVNLDYDLRKHRWRDLPPDPTDIKRKIEKDGYRVKWSGK